MLSKFSLGDGVGLATRMPQTQGTPPARACVRCGLQVADVDGRQRVRRLEAEHPRIEQQLRLQAPA